MRILKHGIAPADTDRLAGDPASPVRGDEHRHIGQVLRPPEAAQRVAMFSQLFLNLRGKEFYDVVFSKQAVFPFLLFLRHGGTRAYAVGTDLKPAEFPGWAD